MIDFLLDELVDLLDGLQMVLSMRAKQCAMRTHSRSISQTDNLKLLLMHRAIRTLNLTSLTLFSIPFFLFIPREGKSLLLELFVQHDILGEVLQFMVNQMFLLSAEETGKFRQSLLDVVLETWGAS